MCAANDISVAVTCPIVAKHDAARRELVMYGGGVHCSKERLVVVVDDDNDGTTITTTIYGRVVQQQQHSSSTSWGDLIDGIYVRSLSQEHGIVVVPSTEDFDRLFFREE